MLEEFFVETCFFQGSLACFDVEVEGSALAAVVDAFFAFEDCYVDAIGDSVFEKTSEYCARRTRSYDGDLKDHGWFDLREVWFSMSEVDFVNCLDFGFPNFLC